MRLRHPDPETLRHWLAGQINGDVDRHVGTCQRCAALMEEFDDDSGPDEALKAALSHVLSPPEDLTQRLIDGVNDRISSRQIMSLVADVFAAGLETSRMLLVEEPDDTE
ncbi:MAG: hypothetical protein AAGD35_04845 [Actinomycetota bacterium]